MSTKLSPSVGIETEESVLDLGDLDSEETEQEQEQALACRNCQTLLHGTFCHACGQQRREGPITFRDLGRHLVDSVFDLQSGFLRTLREGLIHPGRVARRYVHGHRKQYVSPLTFFLVVATAAFLLYGAMEEKYVQKISELVQVSTPPEVFEEGGTFYETFGIDSYEAYARASFGVVKQVQSYVSLGYCFMVAVVLRLFFKKYTIAENLVLELFIMAQTSVAGMALIVGTFYMDVSGSVQFALMMLLMMAFHVPAGRAFFGSGWKASVLTPLAFLAGYVAYIAAISIGFGIFLGLKISGTL